VQALAMALAALGVLLGKLLFLFVVVREQAIERGSDSTPQRVLQVLFTAIRHNPQAFVEPFDLVWLAIALYTAWRLCAPVRIPLSGPFGPQAASAPQFESPFPVASPPATPRETPASILLKTGGSMLLSILVYRWYGDWSFAIGFVLLILVHELGHVVANLYYGIRSSPPIFIPFLGAVIALRQQFPDAKVEAISAIAGPVAGTNGAIVTLALYFTTGNPLLLELAGFGFMINLFNLLPLPPLDGGRVMAAVSPWVWILGLVGMGALVVNDFRHGQDVSVLMIMLILALPRVIVTLRSSAARAHAYYRVHRLTAMAIGAAYLALLIALVGMTWYAKQRGAPVFV
jgi:Zn-dependent protease